MPFVVTKDGHAFNIARADCPKCHGTGITMSKWEEGPRWSCLPRDCFVVRLREGHSIRFFWGADMSLLDVTYSPYEQRIADELRSSINIAGIILRERIAQGLSQEQLAAKAGTTQARISDIETLHSNTRFETLDRIAAALGLEVTLVKRAATRPTTGTAFLCFPPAHLEVCCHCGAKRTRYEELPKVPEGHGPHHPNAPHRYTLRNIKWSRPLQVKIVSEKDGKLQMIFRNPLWAMKVHNEQ